MSVKAKFRITDPGVFWSLQTIDQLDQFTFSAPQFEEIEDLYLDTRKRRLLTAGYYCRQRMRTKGCVISLIDIESQNKAGQPTQQWDVSLKGNDQNPNNWPESQVRKRVLKISTNKKLNPIFRSMQTRITRLIYKEELLIARATLDHVTCNMAGDDQQFKTIKITMLIPDDENYLETITSSLQARWPLEYEPRSKFEQVIALESLMQNLK
jgi:inorganic triphosphatase YgiF